MFVAWMQDIIKGGVHLKQDNPSDNKSLAADNDLMAQTLLRHEAQTATLKAVMDKHPATSAPLPLGQTPFDLDDDAVSYFTLGGTYLCMFGGLLMIA
jgi:hypothetical protein